MNKKYANRVAKPHRYVIPNKKDIISKINDLIAGKISREEVSTWATEYILFDDPQIYPEIDDAVVWNAIKHLSGADLITTDRPYLYGITDFEEWLKPLQRTSDT
jgi:hypothetical protein